MSNMARSNYWKCLDCGETGDLNISNIFTLDCCSQCQSKNLELKLSTENGEIHASISECKKCHKFKDFNYYGISSEQAEISKKTAKQFYSNNNQLCTCSSWQSSMSENKLPWILFGCVSVTLVGFLLYWLLKRKKNS